MTPSSSLSIRCFGPFRLSAETGELWKSGTKIRLRGQALQILLCLLEEPVRLRTREELRSRLWPDGTFVDFDHSLNVAVNRLRARLGDSAERPDYIETLPGVGYRFVMPEEASRPSPAADVQSSENFKWRPRDVVRSAFAWRWVIAICTLLAIASIWSIRALMLKHRNEVTSPGIDSIAVLPLANLTRNADDDYLAEGVTEELITELARMGSFRVISRTSIMRYKSTARPISEISRELNVNALIEGTVRRSGDHIRITVQLIRMPPEHHVWADAFDGDIHDVLGLQRDVARNIASKIQNKVVAQTLTSSRSNKRLDPEAYEYYLRGRYFLERRNAEAMNKAVGYFQQALQRDQQYAQAYAGLAVAYDLLGTYELLPPGESFSQVKGLANKALTLDNSLSEAYAARAIAASFWEFNWAAAEGDFKIALSLQPSSAFAHHWYGEHLINIGNAERAVSELKRARDLDPLSLPINCTLGRVFRDAHRYSEAVQQCRSTVELDPNFAMGHWCLGQAYLGQRKYRAAIPELERAHTLGTTPLIVRDLGYAYAALGNNSEARASLKVLEERAESAYFPPYLAAAVYGALGEKEKALSYLERAYDERDSHITYLALDPEMDSLRSDSRFVALIQRLKLPK